MIKISSLPLIKTPEQFFSVNKVVLVDVLEFEGAPSMVIKAIKTHPGSFGYGDKLYLPLLLKGSPENLFINAKNGVPYHLENGIRGIYWWGLNLVDALAKKKIYDFSAYYEQYKHIPDPFVNEQAWFIERFVLPYQKAFAL